MKKWLGPKHAATQDFAASTESTVATLGDDEVIRETDDYEARKISSRLRRLIMEFMKALTSILAKIFRALLRAQLVASTRFQSV
eukprot:5530658-Amphidinium_carterae.1